MTDPLPAELLIEERLAREVAHVRRRVVVTESDLGAAQRAVDVLIHGRRLPDRRRSGVTAAAAAATVGVLLLGRHRPQGSTTTACSCRLRGDERSLRGDLAAARGRGAPARRGADPVDGHTPTVTIEGHTITITVDGHTVTVRIDGRRAGRGRKACRWVGVAQQH